MSIPARQFSTEKDYNIHCIAQAQNCAIVRKTSKSVRNAGIKGKISEKCRQHSHSVPSPAALPAATHIRVIQQTRLYFSTILCGLYASFD